MIVDELEYALGRSGYQSTAFIVMRHWVNTFASHVLPPNAPFGDGARAVRRLSQGRRLVLRDIEDEACEPDQRRA